MKKLVKVLLASLLLIACAKEEVEDTSTVDSEPIVKTKDEGYIANEILNEDNREIVVKGL